MESSKTKLDYKLQHGLGHKVMCSWLSLGTTIVAM
jgi:hypothetical protein